MAFFSRPQTTVVRIAKPISEEELMKQANSRKLKEQRQCRNVLIHGSCKYQDKGCIYYHPPSEEATQPLPPPQTPPMRTETPVLGSLTQKAINAPVFVPKFAAAAAAASGTASEDSSSPPLQLEEAIPDIAFVPNPSEANSGQEANEYEIMERYSNSQQEKRGHEYSYSDYEGYDYHQVDQAVNSVQEMQISDPGYYDSTQREYNPHSYGHEMMDTSYFHAGPVFLRQPLNYLLYTPSMPPELIRNSVNSHYVPASTDLRQMLQDRSEITRGIAAMGLNLPEELQGYHTLVPLENISPPNERKKFGNWHSTVYRAIRSSDGIPHALRRIEQFRMTQQAAFAPVEIWSQIHHPNIVSMREAFTTRSFDDDSLVVSYEYHPNARTLYEAHMKPKHNSGIQQTVYYNRHFQPQHQQQLIPERTLWSYIVQIASAIKKVHDHGQAVRMIDVSKILVTGQNRIRISSCGIIDVLLYGTPQQDLGYLQQEDLLKFGRLIFALCTLNASASNQAQLQKSIEMMKKMYSIDVQALALFLCSKLPKTIDQVLEMIRPRIIIDLDEALLATDRLEQELMGELENARLFRLMCKFGFINERPEFARDPRWSETGDRYVIKLFRDFVFHQVDDHGNPVVNLTHVLTCLNKLDAGTDEKIMLVSRDEQSCLVVSFKDVKECIANAFNDLVQATTASQSRKASKLF